MIALRQMGSFFVGGRRVRVVDQPLRPIRYSATFAEDHDPNGSFLIEAAYVQFFLPDVRRFETPLLLVHGGGLTGAQWESTPDGRAGWLTRFLEAGVACYVIDNVERGRAGFCAIDGEWPDRPLRRSDEEAIKYIASVTPAISSRSRRSTIFQRRQFPGGQAQGHCRRTR
jgi:pimeloyl-ACP methyl ester carboxylesterase